MYERRRAIGLQDERSIQLDVIAQLSEHERGRHAERGATHVAHQHLHSLLSRSFGEPKRFGESARLVELDAEDLVALGGRVQLSAVLAEFIGALSGTGER
jgi:hypothetical protein